MSKLDQALLPDLPDAPWVERAQFFMELKQPQGLSKEAGAPIGSSLVAALAGGVMGGSAAYTASKIGKDRKNKLQRELEYRESEGKSGRIHESNKRFADWVAEHPWAATAIGGTLGAAAAGGLRYMKVRGKYNKFNASTKDTKGIVDVGLPAKKASLDRYFEDRALDDVQAEMDLSVQEKIASVLDSLSENGLRELDAHLEMGTLTDDVVHELAKEAFLGSVAIKSFAARRGWKWGGRGLANHLEKAVEDDGINGWFRRHTAGHGLAARKAGRVQTGVDALRDIERKGGPNADALSESVGALHRPRAEDLESVLSDLEGKAALARSAGASPERMAKIDAAIGKHRDTLKGSPIFKNPTGQSTFHSELPKGATVPVEPSAAQEKPSAIGAHLKKNWPWYAAGAGGVGLAMAMNKKPPEPSEGDGYEVRSSVGQKLEVRRSLGLITQEEYEKEAGFISRNIAKLFGNPIVQAGQNAATSGRFGRWVAKERAVAGDTMYRGFAGDHAVTALENAKSTKGTVEALEKRIADLSGNQHAADEIGSLKKQLGKAKASLEEHANTAESMRQAQLVKGDHVSPTYNTDVRRHGTQAEDLKTRATAAEAAAADSEKALKSSDMRAASILDGKQRAVHNEATKNLGAAHDANKKALEEARAAADSHAKNTPKPEAFDNDIADFKAKNLPTSAPPATPPATPPAPAGQIAPAAQPTGQPAAVKKPPTFMGEFGRFAGNSFQHPFKSVGNRIRQADNPAYKAWAKANPGAAAGATAGRLVGPAAYMAGGAYVANKTLGGGGDE